MHYRLLSTAPSACRTILSSNRLLRHIEKSDSRLPVPPGLARNLPLTLASETLNETC